MNDIALPNEHDWKIAKEMSNMYIKTGFLPQTIKTPEQALLIAMKGRELGIPFLQSFSSISVIQGKPTLSAELMLALIYKNCPGAIVNILESTDTVCVIEAKRPGKETKFSTFTFAIEDAKRAELLGKDSWRKYPAAMYRARCISAVARALFPDALSGCVYTPEELGAEVNEDGEVLVSEAPPKLESKDPVTAAPAEIPARAFVKEGVVTGDIFTDDPTLFIPKDGKLKGCPLGSFPLSVLLSYKKELHDHFDSNKKLVVPESVKQLIHNIEMIEAMEK